MTTLHEHLLQWVPRQRWYTNKSGSPALTEIGRCACRPATRRRRSASTCFSTPAARSRCCSRFPSRPGTPRFREEPMPPSSGVSGQDFYYDAPHDPAFAAALVALMFEPTAADDPAGGCAVRGTALTRPAARRHGHGSHVLRGEQSNTSIILDLVDDTGAPGTPVICKLFRVLHAGENPDVAVQCALSAAGSRYVPTPVGLSHRALARRGRPGAGARGLRAGIPPRRPGCLARCPGRSRGGRGLHWARLRARHRDRVRAHATSPAPSRPRRQRRR